MPKLPDYDERLLSLFAGPAGELEEIDTRVFNDDMEAHDPELQERYWVEMSSNFQVAIEQGTVHWGVPPVRISEEHEDAELWMERIQFGFHELAAWGRDDGQFFFVLIDHADREIPIVLMAGVTS